MALSLGRASKLVCQQGAKKFPKLLLQNAEKCLGPCTLLAANLTAYPEGKAPRYKPWPYEKRGFSWYHMPFDRVDWRLDDNSKIIVIDGNLATGKTALGKHIAKQFDLLYVPDVTDNEMYWWETGHKFDSREIDEQLPFNARTCDFETFYSQNGYKKVMKNFPRTQYFLFRYKMLKYAQLVTAHILNTGQGVVMNRGMWSDLVWAHTLRKTGWMSAEALKQYKFQFRNATDYWWHPHVVIYLDAPVDLVRENVKKRNVPWEQNSPVLTDDFFQALNDSYHEHYLPEMRQHCEVLQYEISDLDYDIVVEDLEMLDLDKPTDDYPDRFADWNDVQTGSKGIHNRYYNEMRRMVSPKKMNQLELIFGFHPPYEAPELWLDGYDYYEYESLVLKDPRSIYDEKYANKSPFIAAMTLGSSIVKPCEKPLRKPR